MNPPANPSPVTLERPLKPTRSNQSIQVLISDDQDVFRHQLRQILELEPDILVVGEAADGSQAVELAQSLKPDIVIMDICMPQLDGIQATRQIVAADPTIQVIVLTVYQDSEHIYEALRAGAKAHLTKDMPIEKLIQTIRATYQGQARIDSQVTALVLKEFRRLKQIHETL